MCERNNIFSLDILSLHFIFYADKKGKHIVKKK